MGPRAAEQLATFIGVMRLQDQFNREVAALLKPYDLTGPQYNVLRILRGAGESGLACREISARMLTRVPDVTRLVDRLVRAGFADRRSQAVDRRVVRVRITGNALTLLATLDKPTRRLLHGQFEPLNDSDLRSLRRLLESLFVRQGSKAVSEKQEEARTFSKIGVNHDTAS